MRLLVMGASGRLGSRVVREALDRGHDVTAAARSPQKLEIVSSKLTSLALDVRDGAALRSAVAGHHAVISTLGYRRSAEVPDVLEVGMRNLIAAMAEAGVDRLMVCASAGILQRDPTHLRCEGDEYPESFREGAAMHRRAWETLASSELEWTLVCPPELVPGESEQRLQLQADFLPPGPRKVSIEALARWMVTELVARDWFRRRVGVCNAP